MSAKICMLLNAPYPNDIRVTKEASSLIAAGYDVHLLCLQRKGETPTDSVNGLNVHRIAVARSFFWQGIWDILVAINFFHPVFFRRLKKLQLLHQFDVLHVHDLPLARTALKVRDKTGKPKVIVDLHENYPEALRVWFAWKKNPIIRLKNNIFFSFERWLRYEKKSTQKADLVIVVVDEMKKRVSDIHDLPKDKVAVITNSESRDFIHQKLLPEVYDRNPGDFILAYTGGVGPHRGVDVCIKGMSYLKAHPGIRLEITGTLSAQSETWLKSLTREYECEDVVKINGYQPFEKFFSYMKLADVNLIPHNRNGHTDNTIPHKLYQGMLTANPVLVSSAPPLKRIVEDLESGLVFEGGNPEDFARQVTRLYEDRGLKEQLGRQGYEATFDKSENWEATGEKLVEAYKKLML